MQQGQQGQQRQGQQGQPQQGGAQSPTGQAAAEQEALRRALGELMRRMGEAGMEIPRALGQAEMQMRGARGALQQGPPGEAADAQTQAVDAMQRGGQAMMQQLQEQMAQPAGRGAGRPAAAERPPWPRPAGPGRAQRRRPRYPRGAGARGERSRAGPDVLRGALSPLRRPRPAVARARLLSAPAGPVLSHATARASAVAERRRPAGRRPVDMLVLHYTGMASAEAALDRLRDPAAKVSAHYLIDEDGTVVAMVPELLRAWHAGVSWWQGRAGLNDVSIGIELVNPGHEWGYRPFPDAQMAALVELAQGIVARWPIPAGRVVGHSDIAPTRKEDPGELFDWRRLAPGRHRLLARRCRVRDRRSLCERRRRWPRSATPVRRRASRWRPHLARLPAPLPPGLLRRLPGRRRPWAWWLRGCRLVPPASQAAS